jgi:hypothetical protein
MIQKLDENVPFPFLKTEKLIYRGSLLFVGKRFVSVLEISA